MRVPPVRLGRRAVLALVVVLVAGLLFALYRISPLANPPPGCTFHTRCPFAFDRCKVETPALKPAADGRRVACHLVD